MNFLPPEMANIAGNIEGFTALNGATLESVEADTQVDTYTKLGEQALSVTMPAQDSGFVTAPIACKFPYHLDWDPGAR